MKLNKINYFELFTKDKVVCFLLLIHNISKRLDNKFMILLYQVYYLLSVVYVCV